MSSSLFDIFRLRFCNKSQKINHNKRIEPQLEEKDMKQYTIKNAYKNIILQLQFTEKKYVILINDKCPVLTLALIPMALRTSSKSSNASSSMFVAPFPGDINVISKNFKQGDNKINKFAL